VHTVWGVARVATHASHGCGAGSHLVVLELVSLGEEQLSVQTPPGLVVLVNLLTTNVQGYIGNCTLGDPVGIGDDVVSCKAVGSQGRLGCQSHLHLAEQIAVAGDDDAEHAVAVGTAVDSLLNHLHGEVCRLLVDSLEKGHGWLTG